MYKQDLALNNMQRLICHKTQPKQTKIFTLVKFYETLFCMKEEYS